MGSCLFNPNNKNTFEHEPKAGKHNGRSSHARIQPLPKVSASALSVFLLPHFSPSACAHEVKYISLPAAATKTPAYWRNDASDFGLKGAMSRDENFAYCSLIVSPVRSFFLQKICHRLLSTSHQQFIGKKKKKKAFWMQALDILDVILTNLGGRGGSAKYHSSRFSQ